MPLPSVITKFQSLNTHGDGLHINLYAGCGDGRELPSVSAAVIAQMTEIFIKMQTILVDYH